MAPFIRFLLLIGALSGLLAQAQARTWLPHPVALAEKSMPDCEEGMGMEPASDLFGEAALTEEQEREPCQRMDLDCISLKGCMVPALIAEPMQFDAKIAEPSPATEVRYLPARAFGLIRVAYEPPRS